MSTTANTSQTAANTAAANSSPAATTTAAAAKPEDKYKKFEDDGVSFKAKLIGSELVMEPRGDKMCQNSIQRLKAIIKGQKAHKKRIVMKISYKGVRICDEKTNECLYHHEVPQISFIASDDTDSRTFGYVCDVPNKAHQFICFKTSGPALQVMSEISSLFEAVLAKKKRAQGEPIEEEEDSLAGATVVVGKEKLVLSQGDDNQHNKSKSKNKNNNNISSNNSNKNKSASSRLNDLISNSGIAASTRASNNDKENCKQDNNNEFMFDATSRPFGDDHDDDDDDAFKFSSANITKMATNKSTPITTGSKSDLDDLKDLHITTSGTTRLDESPFDLFSSGGGSGAGGDSGIMDLTFNDWLPSPQQQAAGAHLVSSGPPQLVSQPAQQQSPSSMVGGSGGATASAAIPIARPQRPPSQLNFTSSSFTGGQFGGHMLSSTTPAPAMMNSASPAATAAAAGASANYRFPGAQNRSLIYNHSSVSLNDAALSNRSPAFTSPMSPLGGLGRQESTDKYAVFNDIDALPSIFESISSLDSASKLSNAGQQLHPGSQSMDQRQHQAHRRQMYSTSMGMGVSLGSQGATGGGNTTNTATSQHQFPQSPPVTGEVPRRMNPFDDDFFA